MEPIYHPNPPLLYLRSDCRPMLQTYNFNIEVIVWSVNNLDIFFYWNKNLLYFSKNTSKYQTLCPSLECKHIWPLTSSNDLKHDHYSLPFWISFYFTEIKSYCISQKIQAKIKLCVHHLKANIFDLWPL